jgi:hypothetical protein
MFLSLTAGEVKVSLKSSYSKTSIQVIQTLGYSLKKSKEIAKKSYINRQLCQCWVSIVSRLSNELRSQISVVKGIVVTVE